MKRLRPLATLLPLAAILAGSAWLAPGAGAADFDGRRIPRVRQLPPPPPPLEVIESPDVPIYTRPVVGFYAYPYDYGVPPSRFLRGEPAADEPYIVRDDPHGVAVR